jgi:hypothetical protein
MVRVVAVSSALGLLVVAFTAAIAAGGGSKAQITIWSASGSGQFGGATYGASYAPSSGVLVTEQREVDVAANGELRIANIATTADPASVTLRDLTEPGVAVTEQRFLPGATTPTEMLARHLGDPVTVVTPKGDVAGTLRAVDDNVLVVEVGSGEQRRLSVMRRDGFVQDVRVAGGASDKASLVWRLGTKKPGKHNVELTYRAEGMTWSADYLAVIDEAATKVDFSAWATIKNTTGASFDQADVTLVSAVPPAASGAQQPQPRRFAMGAPIKLGANDAVQVELMPARVGAKTRTLIAYEAMPDPSASTTTDANLECTSFNGSGMGTGKAEIAVELDLPQQAALPEGRVRLFRRKGAQLEVVSEDQLHALNGLARIKLAPNNDVTGERRAITCNVDEHAHTLTEKLEVKVENKGKAAVDVAIREFMWRWAVWKLDSEDHKGSTVAPQTHEYRVRVPPKGSQTVSYTVVYSW